MRNSILAIVLLLVASTNAFTQTPKQSKSGASIEAAELSKLETLWNEAHLKRDVEALDRLWSDDLIVQVTSMPVMNKADSLGILRSGRFKFNRYQTSNLRIRVYGDAAVVTGDLERSRIFNDRNVDDKWRFTKVYVRKTGKWQVVAWHTSALGQ